MSTGSSNGGNVRELEATNAPVGWKQRSPSPDDDGGILSKQGEGDGKEEEDDEEGSTGLSQNDSGVLCGLLEVMVVLWEVVEDRLRNKTHRKLHQRLVARTEQNLPVFFDTFTVSYLNISSISRIAIRLFVSIQGLFYVTFGHWSSCHKMASVNVIM